MPIHASCLRSFAGTLVSRICKHHVVLSVKQAVSLGHVVDVGRRADDGVHQARLYVHVNVRSYAKVPLFAFVELGSVDVSEK